MAEQTIHYSALMKLTGFTHQWLMKIAQQGYYPASRNGLYPLTETIQGLFKYFKDRIERAEGARTELAKSRSAVALEDAEWKRLRREEKAGKMLPIDVVENVWAARKAAVRQIVEQMPLSKKQKDEVLEEMEASGVKEYLK
jgi:phage terminase Nu1 subunit (DNA packaging protein)